VPAPRGGSEADAHIGAALRAEARRHTPDSAAMLTRVRHVMLAEDGRLNGDGAPLNGERVNGTRARVNGTATRVNAARPASGQGRDGRYRDRGRRLRGFTPVRVAAAAGAVAVVAGGGWLVAGHPLSHPTRTSPLADASPRSDPATTAPSAGSGGAVNARSATPTSSARTVSPSPTATVILGSPGLTQAQQGFLWSDGSIDKSSSTNWSQSDITLKNTKTVTALTVVLRLGETPGLKNSGAWSTVPTSDMTITVTSGNGVLIYTYTLHSGATLAPGMYEFAGQYSHASGGRNAHSDTYQATSSAGSASAEVYGNFYPAK
jgi:hypothetical protein